MVGSCVEIGPTKLNVMNIRCDASVHFEAKVAGSRITDIGS